MSRVRIGINGFGRIGRSVLRIFHERRGAQVVAVNDLYGNEELAYLLKYDTVMGTFDADVVAKDDALLVDGAAIAMTAVDDPQKIPWRRWEVDCVIEATGLFRTRAELEGHLRSGAEKVILTVPAKDEIDATVVIGVNDHELGAHHRLVSNASCTTNCLAPIAKVLDDAFGVEEGFMTTVHAYTNDQRLADVPHKDLRRSRAAAENLIPTTTGAAKAVGIVLPSLAGRLDGMAVRVPVPDGSLVDLVARLRASPGPEDVNRAVRDAAAGPMAGIVEYSEVPLVSRDIIGNPHSSIFDALCTQSRGDGYVKVVSWYDNEWGYANRVADLVDRLGRLGAPEGESP